MATITPGVYIFRGVDGTEPLVNTNSSVTNLYNYTKIHKVVGIPINISGGNYKISGYTRKNGNPVSRKVYICHQSNPEIHIDCIVTKESDGYFEFRNLTNGVYTIYGVNEDGSENDVIYAHVQAVPM